LVAVLLVLAPLYLELMGSGASLHVPEEVSQLIPEPPAKEREEYINEHHKYWEAYFKKHDYTEAYESAASQTSKGALAALGDQNFQNCLRIALGSIGKTQESPKDVDQAVAMLCRALEVSSWKPVRAAKFLMDHPKKNEVLEAFLKVALSSDTGSQAEMLLEALDAAADGMDWIFAKDNYFLSNCGLTLSIQNSSNPKLNGEYFQEDRFHGCRPVFHCRGMQQYLFYNSSKKQWQIYKKLSGRGHAILKTKLSPVSEGVVWEVRKKEGEEMIYGEEPEMTCKTVAPPSTVEEMIAKAPKCIYVVAEDDLEFHGAFSLQDEPKNERPCWINDEDMSHLVFDKEIECWKVCNDVEGEAAGSILLQSRKTIAWSPEFAWWEGFVELTTTEQQESSEEGKSLHWNKEEPPFVDPDFPHSYDSLKMPAEKTKSLTEKTALEWVRAIYMQGLDVFEEEKPVLFENIEPSDICQGSLGNCWLVASFAAVAEFPCFIQNHVFATNQISQEGKYQLRLFDWTVKEWKSVTVDECIPCHVRRKHNPKPYTIFAKPRGREIYVPILEKAFAKFAGNYGNLWGGWDQLAFTAMTGEMGNFVWTRKAEPVWTILEEGVAVRSEKNAKDELGRLGNGAKVEEKQRLGEWIRFRKREGEGPDEGWFCSASAAAQYEPLTWIKRQVEYPEWINFSAIGYSETVEEQDNEGLWSKICEYDEANYLMACHVHDEGIKGGNRRSDGLVQNHVYSILKAKEVAGRRLVCCRNPWGSREWNGPWSDSSEEWTEHPEVAEELNLSQKTDGMFWMDYKDFSAIWTYIGICPMSMPTKRADFDVNEFSSGVELEEYQREDCEADNDYDFESEHHILWDASVAKDWEKLLEVLDSQLKKMCKIRLGASNYRTVVTMGVRALTFTGKALDGPVLAALQQGMKVLKYPKERAKELVNGIPADQKAELLRLYEASA